MPSKIRLLLSATAIVASFALAACGSDDSDTTAAETEAAPAQEAPAGGSEEGAAQTGTPSGTAERSAKVTIADFAYDPDPIQVAVGGKVIWQNEDSEPHTATADDGSFDTEDIEEGNLKSESFKQPGTIAYSCEIHPQMHGTVEVVED